MLLYSRRFKVFQQSVYNQNENTGILRNLAVNATWANTSGIILKSSSKPGDVRERIIKKRSKSVSIVAVIHDSISMGLLSFDIRRVCRIFFEGMFYFISRYIFVTNRQFSLKSQMRYKMFRRIEIITFIFYDENVHRKSENLCNSKYE